MITTIFSKSKPINFLIVFSITLIAFVVLLIKAPNTSVSAAPAIAKLGMFLLVFISVLILSFIVVKNSLSQQNNYEILIFAFFLLAIPQSFLEYKIIVSNFFVLLALRRLLSTKSKKESIKKLFDSGFLIGVATLFYFWAILIFPLIFIALLLFSETKAKLYLVPFIGLTTVAVLSICTSIIINNNYLTYLNIEATINFDFSSYNSLQFIGSITMLLSFGLWSSLFFLRDINKKTHSYRPSYKVLFITCMLAFTIVIVAPNKNGSEFLFLFAPLAIIITNYVETIEEKWFKEVFLGLLVVIPIILLVL